VEGSKTQVISNVDNAEDTAQAMVGFDEDGGMVHNILPHTRPPNRQFRSANH
jgi:hypothetical protein